MTAEKDNIDEINKEDKADTDDVTVDVPEETDALTPNDIDNDPKTALTEEPTKVKFLPTGSPQNGDPKVIKEEQNGVVALDKKDLMPYVHNPFWVRLRLAIFIGFWLIWLAMLVVSIVIVVLAPKCPPPPERDWWQKSPIYEIYVRSFKDSNGDGIGDLKGVESKLGYIKSLGVETIWLSPIYKSPMADFGYDVEDYREIDGIFGTMEDFDSLMRAINKKGMKLIMDFIPNHSSKEHWWFKKSINGEEPYTDYYVWKNPRNGQVPNNWLSAFGNSAWTFNNRRKQYYYHQFLSDQPDLNVRNEDVVRELKDILRFWLDKGVHGFRMDAIKHLFEDIELKNEPPSNDPDHPKNEYESLDHIYTANQPETFTLLREFRELIEEYNKTDKFERIMVTEAYGDVEEIVEYYGNESAPIAHFPFNFGLISDVNKDNLDASTLNSTIRSWLDEMPENIGWANWVLGNHDVSRVATRFGEEYIDIMNMIALLLPGTPVTYYGEELGMTDLSGISFEDTQDPFGKNVGRARYMLKSRDPERTPMQWNNDTNAGFTDGRPWLPVNPNYRTINVKFEEKDPKSHLNTYKKLVKLRKEKAFIFGDTSFPEVVDNTFSFTRITKGTTGYCVLVNLGDTSTTVDLSKANGIPKDVMVEMPKYGKGSKVKHQSSKVPIDAKSGMVISFVPDLE